MKPILLVHLITKSPFSKFLFFFTASIFIITLSSCDKPVTTSPEWTHLSSQKGDIPPPGPSTQQTACLILDVDKNGKDDFIIASRETGPSVLWYRRDSRGWTKYVIDSEYLPIEAGGAYHDIDEDGDLDIVFGADYHENKIWWWENPYPDYDIKTSWTRREIKNSGLNKHHDQIFGDFDGDGKIELVFWNQGTKNHNNKLFISEIPQNPRDTQPWTYTAIFSSPFVCEGLAQADIDGDGIIDIVGGGGWFRYIGRNNYTFHLIDEKQRFARVAVGQLIEGGRPEVVFVIGDGVGSLKWYEWTGTSWLSHDLLGFEVNHGHSLGIVDFNGDGNLDIFCGEMRLRRKKPKKISIRKLAKRFLQEIHLIRSNKDATIWIFYGNGKGNFRKAEIAKGYGVHEVKVGDLDGDGDIDILGKPYNWETPRLDIWINNISTAGTLSLDRWQRHIIDSSKPWQTVFINSADIDNDERKDIVTGGWWYKNPGNPKEKWTRYSFGSPLHNMALVHDSDADGDMDVLGTQGKGSQASAHFVWAQNDGKGSFTIFNNISTGDGDFLQGIAVDRFQEGKPITIALSWHSGRKGIQMLTIPAHPALQKWPWHRISSTSQDECLSAGDIDGEGDIDLLLGTKWLRNEGSSWDEFTLFDSREAPDRNRLADINGDGRLDAVVGFEAINKKGKLAWYEQGSVATSQWTEHLIDQIIGPMSLDVGDMDNDGDLDVVTGEHNMKNSSKAHLYIFENKDGKGTTWERHLVSTGDEHHDGSRLVDIDNDGDLDIISIGWSHNKVLLYENRAIVKDL